MRPVIVASLLLFAPAFQSAFADGPERHTSEVPLPTLSSDGQSSVANSESVAQLSKRIKRLEKKLAAIEHHLSAESKQQTHASGSVPPGNSKRAKRDVSKATKSVEQPALAPSNRSKPHAGAMERHDRAEAKPVPGDQKSRGKPKAILLNENTIGSWQRVTLNGEDFYLLPVADTTYTGKTSAD